MKQLALTFAVCAWLAGNAGAQPALPPAALAAEGEARWTDALRIYREHVDQDPARGDVWVRIADIESRLGRVSAAIEALQRASAALPGNAPVIAKLSQAYAAEGNAIPALRAIEAALALDPESEDYLRAHATLATWAGEYGAAAEDYRKLRRAHRDEHALILQFARVSVWNGSSDAAATAYREYLDTPGAAPEAWLELARTESWRGNFAAALDTLHRYAAQFGETAAYARERVAILARGGRPREALRELEPLLEQSPEDFDLNLSRTLALATARRHGDALSSLAWNEGLKPGHSDTRAAESVIRSLLGSSMGPSTTFYNDSDGLQTMRVAPRFDIGLRTDTRLHGGYEHIDLTARVGSGLEQRSGAASATVDHVWGGLTQRFGFLTVGGTLGQARPEGRTLTTYGAFVKVVPADSFAASVERSSGFAAISPRTAGLGLSRVSHRAQLEWMPSLRYVVAIEGAYEDLSDGNTRWDASFSPRAAITRSQRLNLDVGLLLHQFGATRNLDNGYYDPRRYEYYSVVVSPYYKASDNIGVAFSAGLGGQRDDADRGFRLGSSASVEASFGIYERWLLKVHGSATNNRRFDSGGFRGVSGGVVLLRRF